MFFATIALRKQVMADEFVVLNLLRNGNKTIDTGKARRTPDRIWTGRRGRRVLRLGSEGTVRNFGRSEDGRRWRRRGRDRNCARG